jgi:hypothetical protein
VTYWFVSHASCDNARLAPVINALLQCDIPLWFDRPYDLGFSSDRFTGYILEGEPWTLELLNALVRACGIVYFPSEASANSDECRLEIALGRTFSLITNFKIIPVLLDEDSWKFPKSRQFNEEHSCGSCFNA